MRDGGSAVQFLLRILLDSASKEANQLAVDPDLDGGATQDLPVAIP